MDDKARLFKEFEIDPAIIPVDDRPLAEKMRDVAPEIEATLGETTPGYGPIASATFWRDLLRTCPRCHTDLIVRDGVCCGRCDYVAPLRRVDDDASA